MTARDPVTVLALLAAGIGTDPRPWPFMAASTTPGLVEDRPPMDYPGTKRARAADALFSAAALLDADAAGARVLDRLARRVDAGATTVGEACDYLAAACQWPPPWTPDERAAFALAREALAPVAVVEASHG